MTNAVQQPEAGPANHPIEQESLAGDSNGVASKEAKHLAAQARAERARQRQALDLQRENILSQKTSAPARRTALEAALAQIEAQIQAIR